MSSTVNTAREPDRIAYLNFDEATLRRVERNDPAVQGLIIPEAEVVDWIEGAGRIIGESTYLRGMKIDVGSDYGLKKYWYHELFLGVSRNRSNESLELTFHRDHIPTVDVCQILCSLFENNRNFHSFRVSNNSNQIKCFAPMISTRMEYRLQGITLSYCSTLNEVVEDTTSFLKTFTGVDNLVELDLFHSILEETGCIALARLLNNPASTIHTLTLTCSYLNDEGISILSNALTMTNNLTTFDLTEIYDVFDMGWYSFSEALAHPMCNLTKIWLVNTSINDEGITDLGEGLAVNTTVKDLSLSCNESITATGWQGFSKCFRNCCSALEEIDIALCGIDDEGAIAIAIALVGKSSLKRLGMGYNHGITSDGWAFVFHTLLCSVPSLEELEVFGESDDDDPFSWTDHMDWTVLSRSLCDRSSIDRTYSSNHRFHSLDGEDDASSSIGGVPDEILSLLRMNRFEKNKAEVARKKILKCHFAEGGTNNHEFSRMPLTIMPVAIEWIGRHKSELSLMYNVIRELPTLFDVQNEPAVKKQRC